VKQDRLFLAIGGADNRLLERSEKVSTTNNSSHWVRWSLSAAACFAVVVTLLFIFHKDETIPPDVSAPSNNTPAQSWDQFSETGEGDFHLLQLGYGTAPSSAKTSDYIIYVNKTLYNSYEMDGVYLIQPNAPALEGVPACNLKITQTADITAAKAAEQTVLELRKTYADVSEPEKSNLVDGLYIHGSDGTAWNAKQQDVYVIDNRQGGAFLITASYFTEAAEGHGARFSDMIGTFRVITAQEEAGAPAWLSQLKSTAAAVIPAIFSDQTADVKSYFTKDAQIETYGKDVSEDLSVQAIDYTVDHVEAPKSAVVSIRYRLGAEDSFSTLTVKLSDQDGRWLVYFAGVAK